jgi:enoyl-CoA hydratase/carnithine racemase
LAGDVKPATPFAERLCGPLKPRGFLEFGGRRFYGRDRTGTRGMAEFQTLKLDNPQAHVLRVTMSRPEVANAMNTQMGLDLMHCFEDLALDPGETRCIVLTGAGEKAFCAGGDLKERNGMTDEQWGRQHLIFERMVRALMACPTPIIAAVNGAAYAGGCEIALCADFIYAAEHARFALTEVTLGIMPGAGATQNLTRAVGERRAKEIILTGRPFTAAQAAEWGVVNKVVPGADLIKEALETADRIAGNAPISVRQAKQAIGRGVNMSVWDGLAFEIEAYNRMVPTEDRREGIRSFNEKRPPQFKGR